MASRRLAISSLLCNDDSNPPPSSPTSSPTSARTSTARDFDLLDRPSRHHPAFLAQTSSGHTQTAPSYRPPPDAKYTPSVDRPRSYTDSDTLRSRQTAYPAQHAYRRESSLSPDRASAQHQHQQIYPSQMSPYSTQPPTQSIPWSGNSPLYARPSTSSSQDSHFPLTQPLVESRSKPYPNPSMPLTQYPLKSTPPFPPYGSSPVLPQAPQSLSGGLEALAQAASQERRRLSSEFAESKRTASRESATRTPVVIQHSAASSSSSVHEHPREPAPTWRRRSKEHHGPPHKRRKSDDLLEDPIPAEPLEIFQPARPSPERSSLMRISALVPSLLPFPDRTHEMPKPQRSPTLPRVSDLRHSVGVGPAIPIADLLTSDPPPRRISPPPLPSPPSPSPLQTLQPSVVPKALTPPRSSTPQPRSPSPVDEPTQFPTGHHQPYRLPETPVSSIPNDPVAGHVLSSVRSPSPVVDGAVEVEVGEAYNVPTLMTTPILESSEPPTPSPVIPVEMHPSLSPTPIDDQAPTPARSASPVDEFEPEPVPIPEPPPPQVYERVPTPEPEMKVETVPVPTPVSVAMPSTDVEGEAATSPQTEPPRQISIISTSTPLPPPAYSSPVLPMSGPGLRPPSPVRTPDYTPQHPPAQSDPEHDGDQDAEAGNDDDGTESDNMTVDMEFDLAAGVSGDNDASGGGMRTDSDYDMEVDVDDELLRLVNGDSNAAVHGDHDAHGGRVTGYVGTGRYKSRARAASTPTETFFDHPVPPPVDLEKMMREQGQPRIRYQQLQGPGQPLVPLLIREPSPEPKPEPKPVMKGKKKQPTKAPTKPRQSAKPRAKSTTKAKVDASQAQSVTETVSYTGSGRMTKAPPVLSLPVTNLNSSAVGAAAARSRSQSTMPVAGETLDEKETERDKTDDKVYCVCKTEYEEGKVMIACDRCDEWYHMQCLGMSDLEVDLVDQFFCPACIQNNPNLSLRTTHKTRCFAGIKAKDPSSPSACHKPSRGAFSKYCSEECGVNYMQTKIDAWTGGGGHKAKLWEAVRDADAREGVATILSRPKKRATVKAEVDGDGDVKLTDSAPHDTKPTPLASWPTTTVKKGLSKQKERELARLRKELEKVVDLRNSMKQELEIIEWRDSLIKLASQRSEELGECGWDQRLCMDDEEWVEVGPAILGNYDGQDQQEDEPEPFGEWWCRGKKKCDRHAGWQRLRAAEVEFEIHQKGLGLRKLAETERDIRRRIEDIMDPQLVPAQVQVNGKENRARVNGTGKTGKKRKTTG